MGPAGGGSRAGRPPPAPRFRAFGRTHPPFVSPARPRVSPPRPPHQAFPPAAPGPEAAGSRGGSGGRRRPGAGGRGPAEATPPPAALGGGLRAAIRPRPAHCLRAVAARRASRARRDAQRRPHLGAAAPPAPGRPPSRSGRVQELPGLRPPSFAKHRIPTDLPGAEAGPLSPQLQEGQGFFR